MRRKRFANPHIKNLRRSLWDVVLWKAGYYDDSHKAAVQLPDFSYPAALKTFTKGDPSAVWIGHSTYLIEIGDRDLFLATYRYALELIKKEEEYVEMTDILFEYFNLNDLEQEERDIKKIIEERKAKPPTDRISPDDKDQLNQLVSS